MKKSIPYFAFILTIGIGLAQAAFKQEVSPKAEVRKYCTEVGKFDISFYDQELSGTYVILPKKSMGSFRAKLDGKVANGRWIDDDGEGDIIITFNDTYDWFTTAYRNDTDPDKWYTDQWHGALNKSHEASFTLDNKIYRCE